MDDARGPLRPSWFVLAALISAGLVLSAPFVGRVRGQIRTAFPGQFTTIVGGVIAAALAVALIAALLRIRERRRLRYGFVASSLALAVAYSYATRTGNPEVDAVEHFHFVSYGLITLLFYRAWRPLNDVAVMVLPVLSALIVGAADEWFQWFIPNRIGELRDIFLNAAAITAGLLFSLGVDPPARLGLSFAAESQRRTRRMLAAAVIVLAAFVSIVHLGHDVREDGRVFRSIYSAQQLDALAADRTARWRTHPPTVLVRLSAEDQYMSEGLWHVQRRNRAWEAGDAWTAWNENLILERFFAPVLDTPSYVSPAGHRWSPAHRADAEARARVSRPGSVYVSDANLHPIFTWPAPIFWLVVASIAVALSVPWRLPGAPPRRASPSGSRRVAG